MKKLLLLLLVSLPLFGQRYDNMTWTVSSYTPGLSSPLISVPGAKINVCVSPSNAVPCTNYATTYTDETLSTSCANSTQVVLAGTSTCVANSDSYGNFGFYLPSGNYEYTVTYNGASSGPYPIALGVSAKSTIKYSSDYLRNSDTCGIQEASNALPSHGGMVVIDQSCASVNASVDPGKTVRFMCAGTATTSGVAAISIDQGAELSTPVFDFSTAADTGSILDGCSISGANGAAGDLVRIRANRITVQNNIIRSSKQDGIRVGEDSGSYNANNFTIRNNTVSGNTRHGLYIHSATGPNANQGEVDNNTIQSNGGDGIKLGSAYSNFISVANLETNTGCGLNITNYGYNTIQTSDMNEGNTGGNLCGQNSYTNYFIGSTPDSTTTVPTFAPGSFSINNREAVFNALAGMHTTGLELKGSPGLGSFSSFNAYLFGHTSDVLSQTYFPAELNVTGNQLNYLAVSNSTNGTAAGSILLVTAGAVAGAYFGQYPAAYTGIPDYAGYTVLESNASSSGMVQSIQAGALEFFFGGRVRASNKKASISATGLGTFNAGVQPAATGGAITWFQKATHASVDLSSVASGACTASQTETITGAALGDKCDVSSTNIATADASFYVCNVTAADTAKWSYCNLSGSPIDRASDTYTTRVTR